MIKMAPVEILPTLALNATQAIIAILFQQSVYFPQAVHLQNDSPIRVQNIVFKTAPLEGMLKVQARSVSLIVYAVQVAEPLLTVNTNTMVRYLEAAKIFVRPILLLMVQRRLVSGNVSPNAHQDGISL